MKFREFFEETASADGRHKCLTLGRSADLKEAVSKEYRARLLTYPGITEANIDDVISDLRTRYEEKWLLIRERKMSNSLAEIFLDRHGYMRPPGWHSVFFYPDSMMPRKRYIVLCIFIAAVYGLLK